MDNSSSADQGYYRLSRSKGVCILLASLLVNCFLLGLLVAPILHPHGPPPFMMPPGGILEHLTRGLPPGDAAIIRDTFEKEAPIFDASHKDMQNAMQELKSVLERSELQTEALQKALQDISTSHAKMDDAMTKLILETAPKLSAEGRHSFAAEALPPMDMHMPPPRAMPGHFPPHDTDHTLGGNPPPD